MYISIGKLVYPKAEEIEIIQEDVVDKNDIDEHNFHLKVMGQVIASLTRREVETIVDKGGFALRKE